MNRKDRRAASGGAKRRQENVEKLDRILACQFMALQRLYRFKPSKFGKIRHGAELIWTHPSKVGFGATRMVYWCEKESGIKLHTLLKELPELEKMLVAAMVLSLQSNLSYKDLALERFIKATIKNWKSDLKTEDMIVRLQAIYGE